MPVAAAAASNDGDAVARDEAVPDCGLSVMSYWPASGVPVNEELLGFALLADAAGVEFAAVVAAMPGLTPSARLPMMTAKIARPARTGFVR